MATLKAGKRPSSQKSKPAPVSNDDFFVNPLGLDPELIKVIETKGHSHRFINAMQYKRFGHHAAHWRPISRKTLKDWGYDSMDAHGFTEGSSPDDFIYRGNDLVLATRPKATNDRHKAYLKQEAERVNVSNLMESQAQDIRDNSRHSGLAVHEGYNSEIDRNVGFATEDEDT